MDPLKKSPVPPPSAAVDRFLPPESRLSMEPCRLDRPAERKRAPAPLETVLPFRRLLVFIGTALLAIAGGYEMYGVVKVGGVTVLEAMLLAFFLVLFAWVAFSFIFGRCRVLRAVDSTPRRSCRRLRWSPSRVVVAHGHAVADVQ